MENTIAFQIVYLYKNFLNYVSGQLKKKGLNYGQVPFILYIGKFEHCTPSMLKKNLKLDWGYSQRSISKLIEQGFVQKLCDSENSKKYTLCLSSSGKEIFELCHQMFSNWDQMYFDCFSESEKQNLLEDFKEISRRVKNTQDACIHESIK